MARGTQVVRTWTGRRLFLVGLLAILVALYVSLVALDAVSTYPDAVVGGHALTNSTALLAQGLKAVTADGDLIVVDEGSGFDPDECFFLRSPTGTFEHEMACGGPLFSGYNKAGNEVDFEIAVPFRVLKATSGYVGRVSGAPMKLEFKEVVTGDRLWRPADGYDATLTNQGGGTLVDGQIISVTTRPYVTGATGSAAAALALIVVIVLARVPRRRRQPSKQELAWADDAWSSLAGFAVAPPIMPPSPVLVSIPSLPPAPRQLERPPAVAPDDELPEKQQELRTEDSQEASNVESGPRIDVIGPVRHVAWAEAPTRARLVELAAYLATHRDHPVTSDRLRTALWPYDPAQNDVAPARVHEQVSRLRRCLGPDHLPEAAGGYQLSDDVGCDWSSFQALIEAARAVTEDESVGFLQQALALVRGQPFQDVPAKAYGWAWDELLISHMEAAISEAAHNLAARCLGNGRAAEGSWAVRQGLLALPKDERLLDDLLEVAAAGEGRAGLDRAWRTVQGALGTEAEVSPLSLTYRRLRDSVPV